MKSTILCADIGTSSLKACLFDENGQIVCYKKIFYSIKHNHMWLENLAKICEEFFSSLENYELSAISISGNGPTFATEENIFFWNQTISDPSYTGKSIFLPKLLSIKKEYPELYQRTNFFMSGPEYLCWQLTGNRFTVLPEKRYTEAYWTKEELEKWYLDEDKLPLFISPTDIYGYALPHILEYLGINPKAYKRKKIPVFCTSSDFIAVLIGTNTLKPGAACNRTGTSEGINICTKVPLNIPGVRTLPNIIPNLYNGGILIDKCGEKFYQYSKEKYPNISFEKILNDVFSNNDMRSIDLLKEICETVKEKIDFLNEELKKINEPFIEKLRISGGMTSFSKLLELKAKILGIPLEVTTVDDCELMGNFVIANTGLGIFSNISDCADNFVKTKEIFY